MTRFRSDQAQSRLRGLIIVCLVLIVLTLLQPAFAGGDDNVQRQKQVQQQQNDMANAQSLAEETRVYTSVLGDAAINDACGRSIQILIAQWGYTAADCAAILLAADYHAQGQYAVEARLKCTTKPMRKLYDGDQVRCASETEYRPPVAQVAPCKPSAEETEEREARVTEACSK